jgi:hypothetical protein
LRGGKYEPAAGQIDEVGKDIAGRGRQEGRGDIGIDGGCERLAGCGATCKGREDLRLARQAVVNQPAQARIEIIDRMAVSRQGTGGADLGQAAG